MQIAVERGLLVRVFTVTQVLYFHEVGIQIGREFTHAWLTCQHFIVQAGQVVADHAVVLGSVGEGFA